MQNDVFSESAGDPGDFLACRVQYEYEYSTYSVDELM
jgi:hypothetical protein